jgi:hypothetical protein
VLTYLSDEWFAEVHALLPSATARIAAPFVVNHLITDVPSGSSASHAQRYAGGLLVDWHPGCAPNADLTITRSYDADRADVLCRGVAREAWLGSELTTSHGTGDVFGFVAGAAAGDRYAGVLPDGLVLRFALECADGPFGPLRADYEFTREGPAACPGQAVDVVVRAPYRRLLQWVNDDDVLLGHLIVDLDHETSVEGDLFKASAIEGVVSMPAPGTSARHVAPLDEYAACRRASSVEALVDAIDDITA